MSIKCLDCGYEGESHFTPADCVPVLQDALAHVEFEVDEEVARIELPGGYKDRLAAAEKRIAELEAQIGRMREHVMHPPNCQIIVTWNSGGDLTATMCDCGLAELLEGER